jgi:hypothetical protein
MQPSDTPGLSLSAADEAVLEARLKTARMIRMSVVGSVVALLAVVFAVGSMGGMPGAVAGAEILAVVLAVVGLGSVVVAYLLPRLMPVSRRLATQPPADDSSSVERVLAVLSTQSIIQAAFCEVPALFGFILAFIGAGPIVFAPSFVMSLAVLWATIPTRAEWEREIADALLPGAPSGA